MPFANELRLLFTLGLTVAVFASAYGLARRLGGGGRLQAASDALLLGYVIQYLTVALPGTLGVLNVVAMTAVAAVACLLCWIAARRFGIDGSGPIPAWTQSTRDLADPDRLGFVAAALFVGGFTLAHLYDQSGLPVLSTDPLVYHLPAAVQWMQTGRLGLFDTWYWNPAATYSPGTTSTFMYWLMAPMGNDIVARYVQVVPLGLIFLVVARLCRLLGCRLAVAGLIGAAAATSRPFFSQVLAPKDDLIVTAFFGCAVLSLSGGNPRDRLGPWRAALAFGMVLASKYTVLLACPLFLFFADVPFRKESPATLSRDSSSSSRRALLPWCVAVLIALALSMPWYLRTWLLTGNPLYPVDVRLAGVTLFEGMFTTERDVQLRSAAGVWAMLSATYHSLPVVPLALIVAGFIAFCAGAGWAALRDPLTRACAFGVPVTLAIFLLASPHHEVRYVFPLLLLAFAAVGGAITRWVKPPGLQALIAAVFAGVSVATSFKWNVGVGIGWLTACAAVVAAVGTGAAFGLSSVARRAPLRVPAALGGVATVVALALLMILYASWPGYLRDYRGDIDVAWGEMTWPDHGSLWRYVRNETPADATIAFANTAYIYPLYGFDYGRRVVHAPARRGVTRFMDVPRLGETVPGDEILNAMTASQNADPDRATWLANLERSGAQYLLVHKYERSPNPPELRLAREEPARFEPVFEDDRGVVFKIK